MINILLAQTLLYSVTVFTAFFQFRIVTVCVVLYSEMLSVLANVNSRLIPNSVTLDDLERRNSPNRRVISPNSVAFGADYVKVVEDTPVLSAAEM